MDGHAHDSGERGHARRQAGLTLGLVAALVGALVAFGAIAGCGSDDKSTGEGKAGGDGPQPGSYVGRVAGSRTYIGLASNGKQVAGYLCDSAGVSTWVVSPKGTGKDVTLRSRKGEALGTASLDGGIVNGSVKVDGRTLRFHAQRAAGRAGLYRAAKHQGGKRVELGWVLLPDGSQRGATNISDGTSNTVAAAPKLDPTSTTVQVQGAGQVQAHRVGSSSIIAILIG